MRQANKEVREAIKDSGFRHWQIADAMGIGETTFCYKLRHELSEGDKQKVYQAIKALKEAI